MQEARKKLCVFVWSRPNISNVDSRERGYKTLPIMQYLVVNLDEACSMLVNDVGDEFREGQMIAYVFVGDNNRSTVGWVRVEPLKPSPQWKLRST